MNSRARLFEIIEKSINGPIVSEKDFDRIHVTGNIKKCVEQYSIVLTQDTIINMDTDLADRVFEAAIDFLSKCGVYSKDTGRIIQYHSAEIKDQIKLAPSEALWGEDRDQFREVSRSPDDSRRCLNCGSSVGSPAPNQYAIPIMVSYMQEPLIDMSGGTTNLTAINGVDLRAKSPLEIIACWEAVTQFQQVAESVGRPGLSQHAIGLSLSDVGHLSAGHKMRKSDSHCFGIISELKSDNTIFNKMVHIAMLDALSAPYANPIYGGLGGGVPGQAVLLCAEMIALSTVFLATNCGSTPIHPFLFCSTTKEILQTISIAFEAIARNTTFLTRLAHTMVGGPVTKTLLYETIASTIVATKAGISTIDGPRPATGVIEGHCTGLEARFQGEIIRAAPSLSRERAEEIVQRSYGKYKHELDKKPYGKPFWQAYDLKSIKPTEEWMRLYEEVKEEAISWGLPL